MGRSTRAEAQEHRDQIVRAAAANLKLRGIDGATIPQIMSQAGMTHGGFYRHFGSKDELAQAAVAHAFETQKAVFDEIGRRHQGDHPGALAELVDLYLSPDHRSRIDSDCPVAALAGDVVRSDPESPVREPFSRGIDELCQVIASMGGDADADADADDRSQALAMLSTLVGAITLSRASIGSELSDEILAAARAALEKPAQSPS